MCKRMGVCVCVCVYEIERAIEKEMEDFTWREEDLKKAKYYRKKAYLQLQGQTSLTIETWRRRSRLASHCSYL